MTKTPFDYKVEILIKEWDHVQTHISRFDAILFNIRTWAVSAFSAMLAVAATQKIPGLMLLAMLPVSMFWFIDALQKRFQRLFIFRARDIEAYLSSSAFIDDAKSQSEVSFVSPALAVQFRKKSFLRRLSAVLRAAVLGNVLFIYSAMLVLCALSYLFLRAFQASLI
jgi:uncharacterized membrane protein